MANKACLDKDNTFESMILHLNSQFAQQVMMQKELQDMRFQLEQASKTLAQKEQIIGSLEQDLEHMIDQLVKFNSRAGAVVAGM